jgi:hypothetical protein
MTRALRDGTLVVQEVPGRERVPEVEAKNTGDVFVLLVPGVIIIGGLQDRVVSTPALIKPGATVRISVACVERRRWSGSPGGGKFRSSGRNVPTVLRETVYRTSGASLRRRSTRLVDQGEVWAEVMREARRRGVRSKTEALSQVLGAGEQDPGDEWISVPGQVGAFIAAGRKTGFELFAQVETFEEQGRASIDAFVDRAHGGDMVSAADAQERAVSLLDGLLSADWSEHEGVGAGTELRTRVGNAEVVAMMMDDTLVYLSAVSTGAAGDR